MEPASSPVFFTGNKDDSFFRKRHTATIFFTIGLLLFLLPFAELKCGSIALMGNTGIRLAAGKEWKMTMGGNKFMDQLNPGAKKDTARNPLKSGPNIFLLVAIAAGIIGLLVAFLDQSWRHVTGMCAGLLCCIMLIAVMIQFKMLLRSSMMNTKEMAGTTRGIEGLIKVSFTIWFYLSFAAFAAAAFFNYRHHKIEMQDAIDRIVDFEFQRQEQLA